MPSSLPHIPFDVAISTKELLKKAYDRLTPAQRTIIRGYYGLPLDEEGLRYWALLHGHALFDKLGYPLEIFPERIRYQPKEYNQLWAILGRRSGKTDAIGSLIFAYEATCGGHLEYVRPGQTVICVLVSQTKTVAEENLPFVKLTLEDSPLLSKEITFAGTEEIRLKNGITIKASSPTMTGMRGLAMPVVGMDEVSFWYKDAESANPDFEVERAVDPSQAQFPRYKRFGITSPWSKEGLAYEYFTAGTEGCKLPVTATEEDREKYLDILSVCAPTAAMWEGVKEPRIKRSFLAPRYARSPQAYDREYGAQFTDSVSGFLPKALLEAAVDKGQSERAPVKEPDGRFKWHYVAAIDPAFRHDAFPVCVAHYEPGVGVVIDALRRRLPPPGGRLNPDEVLRDYKSLLDSYGVRLLHSDQYQLETLQQLALQHNLIIHGTDFTATSKGKIYGNLQQLVHQKHLRLLDPTLGGAPAEAFHELSILERIHRPNGTVTIAAPVGKHDDMASVIALAARHAVGLSPQQMGQDQGPIEKTKTPFELGMATIKRKQASQETGGNWDEY